MVVVVSGSVPNVRREISRQSFLAIAFDEIDDVIGNEGREPAHAVAHFVARSDVRGGGDHDRDRFGVAP
jgi:hypothetical protein